MLYNDTIILLFAKAPIAGSVNTRLIPDIGIETATNLQTDLIHHRLKMLSSANLCAVNLLCSPDVDNPCFVDCKKTYSIDLRLQSGDDLGERMFNAAALSLLNYKYCILIGTDAPALDKHQIKSAIKVLHTESEVVFIPAEDGGYVLLGLRQAHQCLFQNIPWGTNKVMQQSRQQLTLNNISYIELDSCWDVDRLEDYHRYLAMK